MGSKVITKQKVSKLIPFAMPIIFITVVAIINQAFYWPIMVQLYLLYSSLVLAIYWISKSENRKRVVHIIIFFIIVLVFSLVSISHFHKVTNSIITTGTIDYIDLSRAWKGDAHELTISFTDKNNKKISFRDIVGYSSKYKTGDSIWVICDKKDNNIAEVYDSGDMWLPLFGVLFFLLILIGNLLTKDNKTNKRIIHKRKH
ncbi:DUF3592 domain-containing protein [Pseudobacteroides cellulosolvens]|uniref:Uncharacterized protein n=1 Tax=Pseudobacteroides cellulosolvens ATCC 35603 = DSM 2933 TaxID=398512 RepID=A0A0L6JHE6_9FIRM|nr:DUF3592 domain-containing protein [Pseudobacteroides cellulosolvens]KNY25135.1 hypothetical protein Bccel_0392 [Pseudobacteroides cellulosolvens ATCC 35603 = DSM 2933]